MASADIVKIFDAIWVQRVQGHTCDGTRQIVGFNVAASVTAAEFGRCPPELAWVLR
jgi:hypothetical protein